MDSSYNFFLLSLFFLYSDPCCYTERYYNMCQIFFCVIFLNYISKIDMKWYHTHIPHESWKKHGVIFSERINYLLRFYRFASNSMWYPFIWVLTEIGAHKTNIMSVSPANYTHIWYRCILALHFFLKLILSVLH